MTLPVWHSYSDTTAFPRLSGDIEVDVAIIGGGIAGISTAQQLSDQGLKVVVLEKEKIGMSTTSHSTGNLYPAYYELLVEAGKKFGTDVINKIIFSRVEAINTIEENIQKFGIDCDFRRTTWNYFSTIKENEKKIKQALEKAYETHLKVEESDISELTSEVKKGMRIHGSAQFNPLRYVQGLAKAISKQCLIYENTSVDEIDDNKDGVVLTTGQQFKVRAKYLVHATHSPKGIFILHAEMGSYREYGIACRLKGDGHPKGIYFGYYEASQKHSTRSYERDGQKYMIAISESHKVGHGDSTEHLEKLEQFARENFEVEEVTHKWGGQHYRPADYVPYIGRKTPNSNVFVSTGFSTHGLVYGVVGAKLITDLITGKKNECEEIYKPYRFTPVKSAPHLIKENIDVFAQFVKDYLFKRRDATLASVAPGEGKVIDYEGQKLAIFKGEDQSLEICSAICPHMGCVVHWNGGEKSWDCPCHGSRFKTSGEVIEGPALKALAHIKELTGHEMMDLSGEDEHPSVPNILKSTENGKDVRW